MRNVLTVLGLIAGVAAAAGTVAYAQDACQAESAALTAASEQITQKYKPQLDQLSQEAARRAQKIKDDNPEPSKAGAVLKFDIKITSHDQEFIFGVPSATMKTQTIALDVPSVTMRRTEWSWDLPETKMVMQCINGIPETVCDGGAAPSCDLRGCRGGRLPSCSVRAGRQICTEIPEIRMVTQRASMDVPEISMRRQEIKLDIPEFKIAQQRIVLKIPDFTLVNVEAQQKSTQDQSKALSENISSESASISGRMKTELKSTTADKLTAIFSCTENNIISQRTNSLSEVDGQIDSFTKQAEQARVQKNETVAAAIEGTVKALIASRDQVKAEFEKALVQIRKARDEALAANAKDA